MSKERKPDPELREICPSGVDKEDGTPCWWAGFDKTKGVYWGRPKKEEEKINQNEKRK